MAATDSPLALQMAARVEKIAPPLVDDILAAAALSVIELLDDERSRPDGEWCDAVAAWNGARIRKIMRRGRASAWERAQSVPGVTVRVGSAEVRAFVPGPLDQAPRDLAKLQIQSTPLDEPELVTERPDIDPVVLVIAVTPHVEMSWGKLAAQCAPRRPASMGASDPDPTRGVASPWFGDHGRPPRRSVVGPVAGESGRGDPRRWFHRDPGWHIDRHRLDPGACRRNLEVVGIEHHDISLTPVEPSTVDGRERNRRYPNGYAQSHQQRTHQR